jgi:C4-dicarboxylate transporter DctQ subunit
MGAQSEMPAGSKPSQLLDALAQKAESELAAPKVKRSAWTQLEETLVGVVALAALSLCTYNVAVRYFIPRLTLDISDEVQVYLVIWAVFLALGLVTAADRHVKADLFVSMFPPRLRRGVDIFSELLGLAFSLLLLGYGVAITWQSWSYGDLSTTSLRFPLWMFMAALPTGALLMSVRYAQRFVGVLRPKA